MWQATMPAKDHQSDAEVQLWRAVIITALEEWMRGPLSRRREAEQYLFHDQTDFPMVCRSAGIDADSFRSRLGQYRDAAMRGRCFADA